MPLTTVSPLGTGLSFRLQSSQADALRRHRLADDEPIAQVVNRQLRRLSKAIEDKNAPSKLGCVGRGGSESFRVRLEQHTPGELVERFRRGMKIDKPQDALRHLLIWANDLPHQKPFSSDQDLCEALQSKWTSGDTILIHDVIRSAYDRCTISQAKAWLWSLAEDGYVRLRVPAKSLTDGTVVRLPDGRGKLYAFVEMV